MRKVLIGFGILLALLAGGIFWAISSADDVLHAAIEETGSAALATEVRLEGADVDLIAGRITLTGLEVANPSGFGAGPAIDAGRLDIVMAREASDDRTLVLSRVLIDAPRLAYEVRGGAANLAALRDAAEAYTSGAAASDSPVDATEGLPALRVIVRELVVRDAPSSPGTRR